MENASPFNFGTQLVKNGKSPISFFFRDESVSVDQISEHRQIVLSTLRRRHSRLRFDLRTILFECSRVDRHDQRIGAEESFRDDHRE